MGTKGSRPAGAAGGPVTDILGGSAYRDDRQRVEVRSSLRKLEGPGEISTLSLRGARLQDSLCWGC